MDVSFSKAAGYKQVYANDLVFLPMSINRPDPAGFFFY